MANYEFDESENQLIGELAAAMRFVAWATIAAGVLVAVVGLLDVKDHFGRAGKALAECLVYVSVGLFTRSASRSFRRVVETEGEDIPNIVAAVCDLRRLYRFQRTAIIVTVVANAALLFLAVAGQFSSAMGVYRG
jgi:hypothetical protein